MSASPSPSTQSQVQPSLIQTARSRLNAVYNELSKRFVGHEDLHKILLTTIVAGEHIVMISPPGTAKTATVKTLARLLDASFYSYLLTKYTTDVELFGPFDIGAMQQGRLVRNWSKIVDAEIVFLDEIFKANSAILNALLALMQERIIYDPMTGEAKQARLWTLIGASNEVPTDEELQALYDRFAVKVFFGYLEQDADVYRALVARWLAAEGAAPVASMEDVRVLNDYAMTILRSEISGLGRKFIDVYAFDGIPMLKMLRSKGIVVSDRTMIEKLPKLLAAHCALWGLTLENLYNGLFELLPYVARSADEAKEIRKAISDFLGEAAELVEKLEQAKRAANAGDLKSARELCEQVLSFDVNRIAQKPWLKPRVEAVVSEARKLLQRIEQIMSNLQAMVEGR